MSAKPATTPLAIVLLATAMFSAMGGPALAPALPSIRVAYAHIPQIEFWVKILIAITGLFSAIGAPLFGWFSDRWGRKRALILALSAWGVFGSSGMLPQPFWLLLAGRAGLGLSLGGLLAANTALIADSFAQERQRHMMGLQSAFSSSGVVLSLILTGWLSDAHWRLSFSVFLSAFLVLPFALRISAPASAHPATQTCDHVPFWKSGVGGLYLFGFMSMFAFTIVPTQMPFVMKLLGVRSATETGLLLTAMPIASALAGRVYAKISRHVGMWSFFCITGIIILAGFQVLSLAANAGLLMVGMVLVGAGFGLGMPHVNVGLAQRVPPAMRGRAMGLMTSCKFTGQFFSPILLQPVLAHGGYTAMLHLSGWLMLASALIVFVAGTLQTRQMESNKEPS